MSLLTSCVRVCLLHGNQDWHLGGKCDVFLWGAGRHGQLAEAGRNILVPTTAPSFSQAQQVHTHTPARVNTFISLIWYGFYSQFTDLVRV